MSEYHTINTIKFLKEKSKFLTWKEHNEIREEYRKHIGIDKLLGYEYSHDHPHIYRILSSSPLLDEIDIERSINSPWDWEKLSANSIVPFSFVKKYKNKPWDWRKVSFKKDLDFYFIDKNFHLGWDPRGLLLSDNINKKFLKKYKKIFFKNEFITELSSCAALDITMVIYNKELLWNMSLLSSNMAILISDILSHPNLKWVSESISAREDIVHALVYPKIKRAIKINILDWSVLSGNKYINDSFIFTKHHLTKWDWKIVSRREYLNYDFIIENNIEDMDWEYVCKRDDFPVGKFMNSPLSDKMMSYIKKYFKYGTNISNPNTIIDLRPSKKELTDEESFQEFLNSIYTKYTKSIDKNIKNKLTKKEKVTHSTCCCFSDEE